MCNIFVSQILADCQIGTLTHPIIGRIQFVILRKNWDDYDDHSLFTHEIFQGSQTALTALYILSMYYTALVCVILDKQQT